ncbi:MAG: hypothetical protein OEY49_03800 [Candidatus Heimdallarchaeota archaeon]|nr:hypothetical protein [Candidatus Heimdallarchaeota archaeon]
MEKTKNVSNYPFGILRILIGWQFLWASIDKIFGLGYATKSEKAIINGGKATYGFLYMGQEGKPLAWLFQPMAGHWLTEFLFIFGLFAIGVCLILGIGMRVAGYSGALMMFLMYLASLPLTNNPFVDDHLIEMFVFIVFAHTKVGHYIGLGSYWENLDIVKKNPVLV